MVKPVHAADVAEVVYNEKRWQLFKGLRTRALELMDQNNGDFFATN